MLDPRAVLDLTRVIRLHGVNVIHAHEFAPSVFGAAAARLSGCSCVITMHGNLYYTRRWRRRAAFRLARRLATAVVGVSLDTAVDAEQSLALPRGTIHAIPNGITTAPGQRHRVRAELGVQDGELLVAALGNLSPRKAHAILVKALIQLAERRPDIKWRLAVAGTDQGCLAELRALAADHGETGRIHWLGHRADTEDILAAADVFAMPSLHEGLPLAVMEAMFAGLAVIASRAGGIPEMLTDGVEGLLVPVGDVSAMAGGLERLLTDEVFRRQIGPAARLRAERQFGIAPMMDAYLRLYRGDTRAGTAARVA